jgi:hypothetical protein
MQICRSSDSEERGPWEQYESFMSSCIMLVSLGQAIMDTGSNNKLDNRIDKPFPNCLLHNPKTVSVSIFSLIIIVYIYIYYIFIMKRTGGSRCRIPVCVCTHYNLGSSYHWLYVLLIWSSKSGFGPFRFSRRYVDPSSVNFGPPMDLVLLGVHPIKSVFLNSVI